MNRSLFLAGAAVVMLAGCHQQNAAQNNVADNAAAMNEAENAVANAPIEGGADNSAAYAGGGSSGGATQGGASGGYAQGGASGGYAQGGASGGYAQGGASGGGSYGGGSYGGGSYGGGAAQVATGVTAGSQPPPPIPDYPQPPSPAPDYVWAPGYWGWNAAANNYYWTPGLWARPPRVGLMWTPGYWAWRNGVYAFMGGHWGPRVGYYGGVNYGHGYAGAGYQGGEWRNGRFFYNVTVTNVAGPAVAFSFRRPVPPPPPSRVSFAGGPGGVMWRPTPDEAAERQGPHVPPTMEQAQREHEAMAEPRLRAGAPGAPAAVAEMQRRPPMAGPPPGPQGRPEGRPGERPHPGDERGRHHDDRQPGPG
jgi:hypothetical protein